MDLWSRTPSPPRLTHPGSYKVEESDTDLLRALALMCLKALAADIRDGAPQKEHFNFGTSGDFVAADLGGTGFEQAK
jgi:hypothetical protein